MNSNEIVALIEIGNMNVDMATGPDEAMATITKDGTMYIYKYSTATGSWKFNKVIHNVDTSLIDWHLKWK